MKRLTKDIRGELICIEKFDDNGNCIRRISNTESMYYYYNEHNHCTSAFDLHTRTTVNNKYEYNDKGLLIKAIDGSDGSITEYTYNEDNRIYRKITKLNDGYIVKDVKYEYIDGNGSYIRSDDKEITFNQFGDVIYKRDKGVEWFITHKYDSKNRKIESNTYNNSTKKEVTRCFEYED